MKTQLHGVWNIRHSMWFSRTVCVLLVGSVVATAGAQQMPAGQNAVQNVTVAQITSTDIAAAQQLGQSLGVADWLGPLAPVALSPFFGIACLSGMAIYGQGWVSADNSFLGAASPLNNQAVFWTFLILTLITSLPRLTKVSKPFAQAIDQVEAWAGIITMIALKLMIGTQASEAAEIAVLNVGVVSFTTDALLIVAAAINVFVINTVKFFFEVLIWITPIPTVDAIFEVANKGVCAALMAIYGYSPTIATGINLLMFVVAALVFRWAYRRQVFYRSMLVDAAWALLSPPRSVRKSELTVFPTAEFGPFPARAECLLCKTDTGWSLSQRRIFGSNLEIEIPGNECSMELGAGYLTNSLKVSGAQSAELTFSRWFNALLPELATRMGATLNEQDAAAMRGRSGMNAELA